jgi:hypothetical protein
MKPPFDFNAAYFVKLFAPMALDNEDIVQIFQDQGIQEIVALVKEYEAFPTYSWNTEETTLAMPMIIALTDYYDLTGRGSSYAGLADQGYTGEKLGERRIYGDILVYVWLITGPNNEKRHLFEIIVEGGAPIQYIY